MAGKLQVTMIDQQGYTRKVTVEIMGADAAATFLNATGVLATLQDVSRLGTTKANLGIKMSAVGDPAGTPSYSDLGATFRGISHTDGEIVTLKIPDILTDAINIDGTVDILNATVKAYLDNFVFGTGLAMLSDGEQVDYWINGVLDKR